jgi:hypothetical protein
VCSVLVLIACAVGAAPVWGQSLTCNGLAVDFETGIPADWTVVDNTGGTGIVWVTTADPACGIPNLTNGSGEAACADSDAAGSPAVPYDTELVSNPFNLAGLGTASLDVKAYYRDLSTGLNDRFEVDVWDGASWTNELSWDEDHEPEDFSIDLAAYIGLSSVQVRFRYFGDGYDWYAQADDVALSCSVGPDINVDPLAMSSTQPPDAQVTQNLDISNVGTANLEWEILEGVDCGSPTDIPWVSTDPISGTLPITGTVMVDVTFDSTGLNPGTFNGNLCVTSNDPDPGPGNGTDLVIVPLELTVGGDPDIDVDPLSLHSVQPPDDLVVQPLDVGNVGDGDLDWSILEEPVGGPVDVPASQPPANRFDSQAALETELSGLDMTPPEVSGERDPVAAEWARYLLLRNGLLLIPDWSNDRVMAFDSTTGDLVDANFIPSDPTNLSSPKNAILGPTGDSILVSDQIEDVVQEYALDGSYIGVYAPAGGPNTAIVDNMRGIHLDIFGNLLVTVASGANADAVATFDLGGNYTGNLIANGSGGLDSPFDINWRMAAVEWMVPASTSDAIHRYDPVGNYVADLAPIDNFPQQVTEIANGNVLVADFLGAQEGIVELQPDGTVVGIYDPPTVGGYRGVYELPNGNILTTNGDGVYEIDRNGNLVDTKITGMSAHFIELVTLQTDCTNPSDIPWLSTDPITGTVPVASTQTVDVTFDSTGLAPGAYYGNLCIESNDPDPGPGNGTELVIVPVSLSVNGPAPLVCGGNPVPFEFGPPADWTVIDNDGQGLVWTDLAGCGEGGNYTNGSGDCACASSDIYGNGIEYDTEMVSPAFDTTGQFIVELNFSANYQDVTTNAGDRFEVDVSVDGGSTWDNVLSWNEDHGTFRGTPGEDVALDISAIAGNQPSVMVRYHYYTPDADPWDWYVQVDDAYLYCDIPVELESFTIE